MIAPNATLRRKAGFTLVELVIVILILGILAAVAAPRMFDTANEARASATRQSLSVVRNAIQLFRAENGALPGEQGTEADFRADIEAMLNGPFPRAEIGNVGNTVRIMQTVLIGRSGLVGMEVVKSFVARRSVNLTGSEMSSSAPQALVAEDDRALADIIRLALQRVGYDVAVAHDGSKALRMAQASRFDLIASDYQMPLMNGEEFLRAVRSNSPSQSAILVLCSAKAYELDSERLRDELDLAAVFYKPFSLNELAQTVVEAAEQHRDISANERLAADSPILSQPLSVNCYLPSSQSH